MEQSFCGHYLLSENTIYISVSMFACIHHLLLYEGSRVFEFEGAPLDIYDAEAAGIVFYDDILSNQTSVLSQNTYTTGAVNESRTPAMVQCRVIASRDRQR